jgi:hypothetical protein
MTKAAAKKEEHVVLNTNFGGRFECLHCGRTFTPPTPIEIWAYVALSDAFVKEHQTCKSGPDGIRCAYCSKPGHKPSSCPAIQYTDPAKWLSGPDTGISSRTIFGALTGHGYPDYPWSRGDIPLDMGDFGRCHRLLTSFPAMRARLPEVAEKHPDWGPLVREWETLTRHYESGLGATNEKETVEACAAFRILIRQLIDESRKMPSK